MKRLALIPLAVLVSACDKTPPEVVMQKEMFEYKKAQVEDQIDDMPNWYTDIPKEDDAVYAVGTAVTPDLQLSVDIAVLSAKTTLADRVDSRIRSQLKTFKTKLGTNDFDAQVQNNFEQVTRNLIADADVAGYSVKEQKIVQNGTQYRAYVLLEYKNATANAVIKTRISQNEYLLEKLRETKAFKELDDNVAAQKADELAEAQVIVDAINDAAVQ
ncbi:MAG TPA: hypothetical protein DCM40_15510 [Maribacter sp.]|mgnify:FL=1|jgi:hypothetical protein|nr:hypothetical protein [Maribacter sp.]